ncbi:hypothetical protein ADUPG1_000471, partial [Aduncisulcus paluster]
MKRDISPFLFPDVLNMSPFMTDVDEKRYQYVCKELEKSIELEVDGHREKMIPFLDKMKSILVSHSIFSKELKSDLESVLSHACDEVKRESHTVVLRVTSILRRVDTLLQHGLVKDGCLYVLTGVVAHIGTSEGGAGQGHYIAYTRPLNIPMEGERHGERGSDHSPSEVRHTHWYKCNDASVDRCGGEVFNVMRGTVRERVYLDGSYLEHASVSVIGTYQRVSSIFCASSPHKQEEDKEAKEEREGKENGTRDVDVISPKEEELSDDTIESTSSIGVGPEEPYLHQQVHIDFPRHPHQWHGDSSSSSPSVCGVSYSIAPSVDTHEEYETIALHQTRAILEFPGLRLPSHTHSYLSSSIVSPVIKPSSQSFVENVSINNDIFLAELTSAHQKVQDTLALMQGFKRLTGEEGEMTLKINCARNYLADLSGVTENICEYQRCGFKQKKDRISQPSCPIVSEFVSSFSTLLQTSRLLQFPVDVLKPNSHEFKYFGVRNGVEDRMKIVTILDKLIVAADGLTHLQDIESTSRTDVTSSSHAGSSLSLASKEEEEEEEEEDGSRIGIASPGVSSTSVSTPSSSSSSSDIDTKSLLLTLVRLVDQLALVIAPELFHKTDPLKVHFDTLRGLRASDKRTFPPTFMFLNASESQAAMVGAVEVGKCQYGSVIRDEGLVEVLRFMNSEDRSVRDWKKFIGFLTGDILQPHFSSSFVPHRPCFLGLLNQNMKLSKFIGFLTGDILQPHFSSSFVPHRPCFLGLLNQNMKLSVYHMMSSIQHLSCGRIMESFGKIYEAVQSEMLPLYCSIKNIINNYCALLMKIAFCCLRFCAKILDSFTTSTSHFPDEKVSKFHRQGKIIMSHAISMAALLLYGILSSPFYSYASEKLEDCAFIPCLITLFIKRIPDYYGIDGSFFKHKVVNKIIRALGTLSFLVYKPLYVDRDYYSHRRSSRALVGGNPEFVFDENFDSFPKCISPVEYRTTIAYYARNNPMLCNIISYGTQVEEVNNMEEAVRAAPSKSRPHIDNVNVCRLRLNQSFDIIGHIMKGDGENAPSSFTLRHAPTDVKKPAYLWKREDAMGCSACVINGEETTIPMWVQTVWQHGAERERIDLPILRCGIVDYVVRLFPKAVLVSTRDDPLLWRSRFGEFKDDHGSIIGWDQRRLKRAMSTAKEALGYPISR